MTANITFFFVLTLFSTASSNAQTANSDTLIHRMFTSLKNHDEKSYVALYPDSQQLVRLFKSIEQGILATKQADTAKWNEGRKGQTLQRYLEEVAVKTTPEGIAAMQRQFSKSFQTIVDQGKKIGINWPSVTLLNYQYNFTSLAAKGIAFPVGEDWKWLEGKIFVHGDSGDYCLTFKEMLYLPAEGGWFSGGIRDIFKTDAGENRSVPYSVQPMEEPSNLPVEKRTAPPPADEPKKILQTRPVIKKKS